MITLPTPALLVDEHKLRANIDEMQRLCDTYDTRLWPHIKTHKCVEIAQLQLDAGAEGLVCAKLGEAEAMLPSGVRKIFIAYPLVDPATQASRVRRLAERLETLMLAVTSPAQAEALGQVLAAAEVKAPVLMAVDTGLGREGVRSAAEAQALVKMVRGHPLMHLEGLFTHEGHTYGNSGNVQNSAYDVLERLAAIRRAIDGADSSLTLWPGCSVTARVMATLPDVHAIRPGSYVFGDLALLRTGSTLTSQRAALTVLATVVELPRPGLALIDAGSKTFSSDKTADGISASLASGEGDLHVTRLSEEHGWVTGQGTDKLRIGQRLEWVPAHVCPCVNLADELLVTDGNDVTDRWRVAARGKVS
jgi:D-serine deaminase-like pyridoxal phosphate-dependent protein